MIAFKVMIFVIMLLLAIYYAMLVFHLLGAFKLTNRKVTFVRCVVTYSPSLELPSSEPVSGLKRKYK